MWMINVLPSHQRKSISIFLGSHSTLLHRGHSGVIVTARPALHWGGSMLWRQSNQSSSVHYTVQQFGFTSCSRMGVANQSSTILTCTDCQNSMFNFEVSVSRSDINRRKESLATFVQNFPHCRTDYSSLRKTQRDYSVYTLLLQLILSMQNDLSELSRLISRCLSFHLPSC
jgi:hypothetical protein